MKTVCIVILSLWSIVINGQTAEEIICKTEEEYRKHSNYLDYGHFSQDIYSTPVTSKALNYFLALDKEGNVHHWINEFKFGRTFGVMYTKKANESLGSYQRLGNEEESFPCSLQDAGARLVVTGGGLLLLTASIFYPDYLDDSYGDASHLQVYDSTRRLLDTLIKNDSCYVIENVKKYQITQKMVDDSNRRLDSINATITFPTGFQPPKSTYLPRERIAKTKYYIRKSDFMLLRCEDITYELSQPKVKKVLQLDPKFDVKDFKKYLRE